MADFLKIEPKVGWITLNRDCNMRCPWCYAKGTEYKKVSSMSLELAKSLVLLVKSQRVNQINLIGGEPTLWPSLIELNMFCKQNGMRTVLVTNGTRFASNSFWKEYSEFPNSRIGISIKGYSQESYKISTGMNNFSTTVKGIKRAMTLENVGLSIVYTGEKRDDIVELAKFCKDLGAKSINISPNTPTFDGTHVNTEEFVDPEAFILGISHNYDALFDLFNSSFTISSKMPLCMWPETVLQKLVARQQIVTSCQMHRRSGILFDTDGSLISCNSLASFPIGKYGIEFSSPVSFKNHLECEQVSQFYDVMLTFPSKGCSVCKVKNECVGGCPIYYARFSQEKLVRGWKPSTSVLLED